MIQANELRIGNYIVFDGDIACLHQSKLANILKHNWVGICQPIELTEEILLKCGFNFKDMADLGVHVYIEVSNELSLSFKEGELYIGEHSTKYNKLHQLQNLYFALKGEELEIKL